MDFRDRKEAGEKLSEVLVAYKGKPDVVVAALPRGGVVVGRIVADQLGVPLDIVVPRKIGASWSEEYAIGAIAESGEAVWNEDEKAAMDPGYIEAAVKKEQAEAQRRLKVYRKGLPPRDFRAKTVIIVDDGIATGLTMRAAIQTVKSEKPAKVVVAVPCAPAETISRLKSEADDVVTVFTPQWFPAVGAFYRDFPQIEDEEVIRLLHTTFPKKP